MTAKPVQQASPFSGNWSLYRESEAETETQLKDPSIVHGIGNRAKGRRAKIPVRLVELRSIGHVVGLDPEH
jgi:hypothetical protein